MLKSLLNCSRVGFALIVIAASSQSGFAAENHVITTTESFAWKSATGESTGPNGPLIIEVAKGDTIEFQINGGPHGVVTLNKPGNETPVLDTDLVLTCDGKGSQDRAVLRELDCNGATTNFNKKRIQTLRLEVLDKMAADTNFWCVVHKGTMWGIIRLK